MKKTFYICCLLLVSQYAYGQKEFLVTVDPATGNYSKIKGLPDVKWITASPNHTVFNDADNQFIFKGADSIGNWYLYTIDALTGNIVSKPQFPPFTDIQDNIAELQYDNVSKKLYALYWNNTDGREYFVSINPVTGIITKLDSLPGVKWVNMIPSITAYNKKDHRYYFTGFGNNNITHLYGIDATTGHIISSPVFPVLDSLDNLVEMQYDFVSDAFYALHWDNSEQKEFLVTVDPTTGSFLKLDSIPGVKYINVLPHYTNIDEMHRKFIFRGGGEIDNMKLYSINIKPLSATYKPLFPVLKDKHDNVIELKVNNATGTIYGLHWDAYVEPEVLSSANNNGIFTLYPNPFGSTVNVSFNKVYSDVTIVFYNTAGQTVRKEQYVNTSLISIQRGSLAGGLYTVSIACDHIIYNAGKIVAE